MDSNLANIDASYERYYAARTRVRLYPTEFVVRIFLAGYPDLDFVKPRQTDKILDVGFGDGRNTAFLCDLGLDVHGIELTQGIVDQCHRRLSALGLSAELRVGRNSAIPYADDTFDYLLACSSCYYCDEGESLSSNLLEYARVLKPGGWLVASVADRGSYIFDDAKALSDGSLIITRDPYGNRVGYRLHAFSDQKALIEYFSPLFGRFSIGHACNNYFGITERLFWTVCQLK